MKEIEDFYTTPENLESTRFSFETRERCNIFGKGLKMNTPPKLLI